MPEAVREPVVRIRVATPEEAERSRQALAAAGLSAEASLTWLVVREADPDEVHRALVCAGARGRVAVRAGISTLVGWIIDRQGALEGRSRNVKAIVDRLLADGGLAVRYAPRPDDELLASATALHRSLMAEGAPFLSWARVLELFCRERAAADAGRPG